MHAEPAASDEHAKRNFDIASSASSANSAWIVLLALLFLAFHLVYLPRSLEDLDSINFALGVRHFDVAQHQPHPPGYPVYIAVAKAAQALVAEEGRALALVSTIAGALGVLAIAALFRRLDGPASLGRSTVAAVALAVTAPLYWFTAARPLSDMAGLSAAVAAQAGTIAAVTTRQMALAAFAAGLASGLRSQVAWLTVPLLVAKISESRRFLLPAAIAWTGGILVWLVPLVVVTGGPAAYWHALFNQGAEDLGNISMLWTTHNLRALSDALYFTFIAPWATWPVAALVIGLTVAGAASLLWRDRRSLVMLAVAFGPYFVFHLLFQETFTGRYALPLVVPMAYLAAAALRRLPWQIGLTAAAAIAMFDAHAGGTSVAAYARAKAPAFGLLEDMASAASDLSAPPVLAMDRLNAFDFRRPMVWMGSAMPRLARQLPAPPQHEWLEAVNYWNGGGRAPVWFVVDPKRAAIDLVEHGAPRSYRWLLPYPDLISGARPNEMDWYRVDRPEWYVGEGWSLTPEAAGVAEADHRGLSRGAIDAWIHDDAFGDAGQGGVLLIGGRNFDPAAETELSATVAGRRFFNERLRPGAFLRLVSLPRAPATGGYSQVRIIAVPAVPVAIEQFDASARRPLVGFGDGWHEQEFNPRTGLRWRWLSERGELKVTPRADGQSLHIEGESPRRYFSKPSHLVVRSGAASWDRIVDADFAFDVPIPPGSDTVVLETDQVYAPADRSRRTQDRRHLGLRIFRLRVSEPGRGASSRTAR